MTVARYSGPNSYGRVNQASKICGTFNIRMAGTYRVTIEGIRTTNGRVATKCNHGNKPGSLAACKRRYRKNCVCNDEENDVHLWVEGGRHKQNKVGVGKPAKAMVKCAWD